MLPPALPLPTAPVGGSAATVRAWFDAAAEALTPVLDGTLAAEREAAAAFQRMAKAANTRTAYRAAVRAWCAWCERRRVPPLPAAGADVAAFLAAERGRGLAPNTIDLRRAAIRYLHRAAGCPVPTDDASVSETVAGIRRDAARRGELPAKKVAATATIIRQLLAPIPDDLRGRRDRALLLVGFAGALRRSELAAIHVEHLEKTDRGLRLTLPQTKGSQTDAVTVPLPFGQTELCPVRALTSWQQAANITQGPVCRRIWLPRRTPPGEPPPLPRIGASALTPWAVAAIVQARAVAAGFKPRDFGGHSLKRGALTNGMERGVHPADLKRLAGTRASTYSANTWSSVTCSSATRSAACSDTRRVTPVIGEDDAGPTGWMLFHPSMADRPASDGITPLNKSSKQLVPSPRGRSIRR